MGFAEIRDLNRHRTGSKYCPLVPQGILLRAGPGSGREGAPRWRSWRPSASAPRAQAVKHLIESDPAYIYWTLLGTEFPFEHVTTADKFIYEAELRTGVGAHFRYAKHLRDVLALFYRRFPSTKGVDPGRQRRTGVAETEGAIRFSGMTGKEASAE